MPVAIVTGSNTGIGFHTALSLCRKGYTVIVACRNQERGTTAAIEINNILKNETSRLESGEAIFMQIDTSSLASVRTFASVFKSNYTELHALVLSAGMNSVGMKKEDLTTKDGYSVTFESNYLGHFYLTQLLLPILKQTAASTIPRQGPPIRIVTLSSVTHRLVSSVPDWTKAILRESKKSYQVSKFAMAQFAFELQRRFHSEGIGDRIQAITVNPGGVYSDIWRTFPSYVLFFLKPIMSLFFLNTKQGSATSVAAASDYEFTGGKSILAGEFLYLTPYRIPRWTGEGTLLALLFDSLGPFGGALPALPTPLTKDSKSAKDLWEASETAINKVLGQQA